MSMVDGHPIATKIAIAVAGGVVAWGGANISSNSKTNAVQDQKLKTIELHLQEVSEISRNVNAIKVDVAIVKERTRKLSSEDESNGETD